MIRITSILFSILLSVAATAQQGILQGVVTDRVTGESLIGAAVVYSEGKGVITDINGQYTLELPYGTYELTVSYVGYEKTTETVNLDKKFIKKDFSLKSTTLRQVEIVSDLAIEKETPVAFTNIKPKQIDQELGTNDLPMLLNATPGIYATQTGGADGGPRVNIRGFKQRNISLMIDGIPINNMDDGRIFWSNTFGIDIILANMQVQRGLTSSKLALPAIGGTINYITKSIENKKNLFVEQEYGSFNTYRASVGYNSGRLNNGWGFSVAGSYRKGDGFYDKQFREEFFYYGKVQKELGNHIISLSAMGSPVKYGIRADQNKIVVYDKDYATDLFKGDDDLYRRLAAYNVAQNIGREINDLSQRDSLGEVYGWTPQEFANIASQNDFIDTTGVFSKDFRYNNHWGYLNGEVKNERLRDYHKPIFSLRDLWRISDRLYFSNVVYYSFGKGGITNRIPFLGFGDYDEDLQVDFDGTYRAHTIGGIFGPPIDPLYSDTERKSGVIMRKVYDNHTWLGYLGTLDFQANEFWSFSGGLDFRYYTSSRYAEVDDLLGGDYYVPALDELPEDRSTSPENRVYREGDRYGFNSENRIRWGAFFAEGKYNKDQWTAFVNLSGVISGYKRVDYFGNRDFIGDNNRRFANAIGYGDVLFYNGQDVLVAADNINIGSSSFFTSGDTTFVNNPSDNQNDYAPAGQSYILNAEQVDYDDSRTQTSETPWKNIPGFTIKTGIGYSINERNNVFINLGYLSRTPRFSNVVDFTNINQFFRDIENENIASIELGYGYSGEKIGFNVNAYYTDWRNRPYTGNVSFRLPGREIVVRANVNAMNARHQGIEFNGTYNITPDLAVEAFISLGDWIWTAKDTVNFFDDRGQPVQALDVNGNPLDSLVTIAFDAEGVAVGDAPQTMIGGSIRYNILKNLYIKGRYTYFARNFSDFSPFQLQDEKAGRQSWMLPNYSLVSVFAGYNFKLSNVRFDFNVVIDNLLDVRYLSDGQNNAGGSLVTTDYLISPPQATVAFDANSTAVYFGPPRTFGLSLKATL